MPSPDPTRQFEVMEKRFTSAHRTTSWYKVILVAGVVISVMGCATRPMSRAATSGAAPVEGSVPVAQAQASTPVAPQDEQWAPLGSRGLPASSPSAALSAGSPALQAAEDLDHYRLLLGDTDEGIRIAAARALLERGDLTGKPLLLQALRDADVHHRIDAALALERVPDRETVAALRQAARTERHPLVQTILKQVLKRVAR